MSGNAAGDSLDAVIVRLVLHDCVHWEGEDTLQGVPTYGEKCMYHELSTDTYVSEMYAILPLLPQSWRAIIDIHQQTNLR